MKLMKFVKSIISTAFVSCASLQKSSASYCRCIITIISKRKKILLAVYILMKGSGFAKGNHCELMQISTILKGEHFMRTDFTKELNN